MHSMSALNSMSISKKILDTEGIISTPSAVQTDVQSVPGKGRGVVTLTSISINSTIVRDPVERYTGEVARRLRDHSLYYHLFVDPRTYGNTRDCDLLWVIGPISIVNHADNPNCSVHWQKDEVGEWAVLKADREIAQGEELLVSYTNIDEYMDIERVVQKYDVREECPNDDS